MPSMFDAMRTSFETQQGLTMAQGRTAAGVKYTQERKNIEDELARLEQQEIETQRQYATAGREAQKKSSKKFWKSLGVSALGQLALTAATGGLAGIGIAGLQAFQGAGKLAQAAKFLSDTKTGKNILRGASLARGAAVGTKAGKKELKARLADTPEAARFIEEPGAEFLGQERKRGREAAAGYERGRGTMKEMMEGAYEGMGGVGFLSPSGIKQMMAGAQAYSYADTLVNMADFAKLFGSKQSVVGEQAIGKMASLQTPETAMQTGVLEMPQAPSLSPYGAGKEAFALQPPGGIPDLAYQAAPTAGQAAGAGAAQPSMSQMFGGGLGGGQPSLGQVGAYTPFQSLSGQGQGKALQIGQKFNLKPSSFVETLKDAQARAISKTMGPAWSPATAQLPGMQSVLPSSTRYGG